MLTKALWMSDVRNISRYEVVQSVFNILQPGLGMEMIPHAQANGVAVVPYSPLSSVMLTGKHPRSGPLEDSKFGARDSSRGGSLMNRYWNDSRLDTVDRLVAIAKKHNQPMIRLALQWVSDFPGITAPIFGARRIDQVEGIIEAHSERAPDDVMAEVAAVADEFAASSPMTYPPAPSGAAGQVPSKPA
jgi:aryl-alcohol dehydrogenase-like predicted oxidoreductase